MESSMRNLLFILASTATFAVINPTIAQYGQPGVGVGRGYTAPGYTAPGYMGSPNNATASGSIRLTDPNALVSKCARGFSVETCVRRENAIGSGSVDLTDPSADAGECAKGFSEETCRRRGQKYTPTADFESRWPIR